MKDELHAIMLQKFSSKLKFEEDRNCNYTMFESEHPFNHYGERGFIDLLTKKECDFKPKWIHCDFYEFKTDILDTGETIRQLKKYFSAARRESNKGWIPITGHLIVPDNK